MAKSNFLYEHASQYADEGIKVFPAKGAFPVAGLGGLKNATTDPERIEQYWGNEYLNIVAPTGEANDLVVVQIESDDAAGIDGLEYLADRYWQELSESLADAATISTPNGGDLLVFRGAKEVAGSALGVFPGVDVHSGDSFFQLPPSSLKVGEKYKRFAWATRPEQFPQVPSWVVKLASHRSVLSELRYQSPMDRRDFDCDELVVEPDWDLTHIVFSFFCIARFKGLSLESAVDELGKAQSVDTSDLDPEIVAAIGEFVYRRYGKGMHYDGGRLTEVGGRGASLARRLQDHTDNQRQQQFPADSLDYGEEDSP